MPDYRADEQLVGRLSSLSVIQELPGRLDDNTVFFARELDKLEARSRDVKRANLDSFLLIPIDATEDPGAETITYQQYDHTGLAKIIANYADDLPQANVAGKEFTAKVRSLGASYDFNLKELMSAQMAGKPLETRKADAATRSIREKQDRIAFFGDAESGLQGWLTNTNIPSDLVAADGTGSATEWTTKTPDLILRDLNALANGIVVRTNGVERPDTIAMPVEQYSYIASTPRTTGTDTTILDFFLKNNPYISEVIPTNRLSAAELAANLGDANTFTGDIMIAYQRSAEAFDHRIPMEIRRQAPQERNLTLIINMWAMDAGVRVFYPFSQAIGEGI